MHCLLRRLLSIVIPAAAAAACAPAPAPAPPPSAPAAASAHAGAVDSLGSDVVVRHLAGRVWLHVTLSPDATRYPSNGLLVEEDDGVLLIDSAWNDEQTGRLAAWSLRRLGKPIRRAIATHFHEDRLGGIDTLRALGVHVGALDLTRAEASARGVAPLPEVWLTAARGARTDAAGFEVFYPGPGHSRDNVVVWLPREGVLFGGCLVKAADARTLGNVADADVPRWPETVARVLERYPRAAIVVPGHGAPGGTDLLTHTRALLTAAPAAQPGG